MNPDHTYIDVYECFSPRTANAIRNNMDEYLFVSKEFQAPTKHYYLYNVGLIKQKGRKWWLNQNWFGVKCLAELESVVGRLDD